MKASTKSPEEELVKIIEERVAPLGNKLDEILDRQARKEEISKESQRQSHEESQRQSHEKPREEKIEDILKKIRDKSQEKLKIDEKIKEEKSKEEKLKEATHDHIDIDCPTCGSGHVHKLVGNGLTLKCADGKCNDEFVMLSKTATHACSTCGFPVKKPAEGKKIGVCPMCGGAHADPIENGMTQIKFDFSKMKK